MKWRAPADGGDPPARSEPFQRNRSRNGVSPAGTLFAAARVMTRRRIIVPGTTWALSRRTTRRYFLLNPDQARELEQCYWYCLGLAAQRFGVLVHAGCLMSTHSHGVSRYPVSMYRPVVRKVQHPGLGGAYPSIADESRPSPQRWVWERTL